MADPHKESKEMEKVRKELGRRMDDVYRITRSNDKGQKTELSKITSDITDRIKRISAAGNTQADAANIVRIISKASSGSKTNIPGTTDVFKSNGDILSMFQDRNITDNLIHDYYQNIGIKEYDNEINTLLRYMPALGRALDVLKYATISSDSMGKEFLSPTSTSVAKTDEVVFTENFSKLMEKYDLERKISGEWYDDMSRYGETLVYRAPYRKEIKRLLDNRENTKRLTGIGAVSAASIHEMVVLENDVVKNVPLFETIQAGDPEFAKGTNIKVIVDNRGVLESAVSDMYDAIKAKCKSDDLSIRAEFGLIKEDNIAPHSKGIDVTVPGELNIPEDFTADGFIDETKPQRAPRGASKNGNHIHVNGVIIKKLKRENLIFLYIGDVCIGYYYFEVKNRALGNGLEATKLSSRTNMFDDNCLIHKSSTEEGTRYIDQLTTYISSTIAHQIDADFVNRNQDLQKEIYALLTYNDVFNDVTNDNFIKVTFIPADDVTHFYFKQDPDTHRGISDLHDSLLAAKFWVSLNLSDLIGRLTRAQDHRAYYVKQTVETNISQTLMNVINQIKRGNFGLRQIETMSSILNVIGKYNDYFIPVGQNGEAPIQFETMEGQKFDTDEELKNTFFEEAIGRIVPPETIQNNFEFATQITSANIQFIRLVLNRQKIWKRQLSEFFTAIYNYEYGTDIDVKVTLPPPITLQINNLNQIYDATVQLYTNLANLLYPDANDSPEKQKEMTEFIKVSVMHQLSTYLDASEIDRYMLEAKQTILSKPSPAEDDGSGGY